MTTHQTNVLELMAERDLRALRSEAGAAGDYTLVNEINAMLGVEIIDGVEEMTR